MWALLFVLCLAMSGFAQNTAKKNNKTIKPEAAPARTNPADSVLTEKERAAWRAIQTKQIEEFGKMIADDFRAVSADQIYDKNRELTEIKQATFSKVELSDMHVVWADKNTGVVTAIVSADVAMPDGTTESTRTRTTSVWTLRGKDWLIVYHTDSAMD
jgi:ketosteroid isomerase-like protein